MNHARDIMKNAEDNFCYRVQVDDLIDRLFHGVDTGKVKDKFGKNGMIFQINVELHMIEIYLEWYKY